MDDSPIPFARPCIGAEEEEAALRVLRSGWLTTGAEALAFEAEFAAFLDARSGGAPGGGKTLALALSSATAGLHLALEALGVKPGDLVLVPAYTFTATAAAARYLGAEVVFIDSVPGRFEMCPHDLRLKLERLAAGLPAYGGRGPAGRPAALIPVHFAGLPCDMAALMEPARQYGLAVVEDCAHCFPSTTAAGAVPGLIGDAGVFSFYATKTITTGEGGMAVSRDEAAARRMALMRLHGIDRPAWNRYTDAAASWYYEVAEAGYKYNLPDLLAAVGRAQLRRAEALLAARAAIAARYDAAFAAMPALEIPPSGPGDARHLYPLRVRDPRARDGLARALQSAGVGVSVHFIPLHTMPYYRARYGLKDEDAPHALDAASRELSLPVWPGMSGAHIDRVIGAVAAYPFF